MALFDHEKLDVYKASIVFVAWLGELLDGPLSECRLSGEYVITGGGRLRRASVVEWDTVFIPNRPDLHRISCTPCWRRAAAASRASTGCPWTRSTT